MSRIQHAVEALETFFGSFGLPVYPEEAVPEYDPATGEAVRPPYITVQLDIPDWTAPTPTYARIWDRATDFGGIVQKADEIGEAIGEGVSLPTGHGALYLYRQPRFCQLMSPPGDRTLKSAYLSMTLHALTD